MVSLFLFTGRHRASHGGSVRIFEHHFECTRIAPVGPDRPDPCPFSFAVRARGNAAECRIRGALRSVRPWAGRVLDTAGFRAGRGVVQAYLAKSVPLITARALH